MSEKPTSTADPLFESDDNGMITRVRGKDLPRHLLHALTDRSFSDRAPSRDSAWVIRGVYKFARRVQGR